MWVPWALAGSLGLEEGPGRRGLETRNRVAFHIESVQSMGPSVPRALASEATRKGQAVTLLLVGSEV